VISRQALAASAAGPWREGAGFMADISKITEIAGFIGACLVDVDTGLMLTSQGGGAVDLEAAAALNAQVLRAEREALHSLGVEEDIDDIVIMLGNQIHVIRPLTANTGLFLYTSVDRKKTNLGMARLQVREVESTLEV
jgi:predicted regulator of Ras-like GTPase activity (Roadblock/LC7/MglB family)